jgi:glycerate 2-kinase
LRRVVIAPDKFKGSASAHEVAHAIQRGLRSVSPASELILRPMADGGDGTVELFLDSGARACTANVHDPLGRPISAKFALDGERAIVELASASGLVLEKREERDPWRADSRGTGELIRAALDAGAKAIVIGIGGSASNDAGIGLLRALGAKTRPANALHGIESIDLSGLDPRIAKTKLLVASDVDNPLCGPNGASAVFGPQKGAKLHDVTKLDAALAQTADAMARALGRDLRDVPGAGAAGGAGFALLALGAELRPGVDIVAELCGLPQALSGATLCMTGEGSIDAQTLRGKTVFGVGRFASQAGVPVIALGGRVDASVENELATHGIVCEPVVTAPMPLEEAMRNAAALIEAAAARIARTLALE